jgi:hypothetical protein
MRRLPFIRAAYHGASGLRRRPRGSACPLERVVLVGPRVDDFVFLRPTQSEAVLLQFGDLAVVRGERVVERWPVLASRV